MRSPTRRPLWPGRSSSSLAPIDGRTGNASLLKTLGVTTVAVKGENHLLTKQRNRMNALVGLLARQGVDPDLEMPRQMTRANPLHSHRNVSAPQPSQQASTAAEPFLDSTVMRLPCTRSTGRNLQAIALYWKSFIALTRVP
jgi:hypothetical protein